MVRDWSCIDEPSLATVSLAACAGIHSNWMHDRLFPRKRLQAVLVQEISPLPEVVVFDLDYCLWPYWCDMKSASAKASYTQNHWPFCMPSGAH